MSEHTAELLDLPEPEPDPLGLEDKLALFFLCIPGWEDYRTTHGETSRRIERRTYETMSRKYPPVMNQIMDPDQFDTASHQAFVEALNGEDNSILAEVLRSLPSKPAEM